MFETILGQKVSSIVNKYVLQSGPRQGTFKGPDAYYEYTILILI